MRETAVQFFKALQDSICQSLEATDGKEKFIEDLWSREDSKIMHGGGGRSRVIKSGLVFEQGGVNFSEVFGTLPHTMSQKLTGKTEEQPFFATGVSLVIHPFSPLVPTTHANFRYLEVGEHTWFGGGMDLTPYYLIEEDAIHFHQVIKDTCDSFDPDYYPRFKKWCDEYFYLPHRGETRGIGGLFFDYLGKDAPEKLPDFFSFTRAIGEAFTAAYIPIVEKRSQSTFTSQQRDFQLLRRGRYVEFNLLYDRGTQFGLHTGGRTESILMSLPPLVRWEYCATISPNSPESTLIERLKNPVDWIR